MDAVPATQRCEQCLQLGCGPWLLTSLRSTAPLGIKTWEALATVCPLPWCRDSGNHVIFYGCRRLTAGIQLLLFRCSLLHSRIVDNNPAAAAAGEQATM